MKVRYHIFFPALAATIPGLIVLRETGHELIEVLQRQRM